MGKLFLTPMIYLSGFTFPIENMPGWIQWMTYLIPLRYFLVIVRGIFLKGVGVAVLWPQIAALLACGLVLIALATLGSSKRLAALGVVLLLPIRVDSAALDPVGVLCALAAGVGWALCIVFGQKAGQAHGPGASTWGLIVAAVFTVPIGIIDAGAKLVDPAGVGLLQERLTTTQWSAIAAIVVASVGAVKGDRPELAIERADFAP